MTNTEPHHPIGQPFSVNAAGTASRSPDPSNLPLPYRRMIPVDCDTQACRPIITVSRHSQYEYEYSPSMPSLRVSFPTTLRYLLLSMANKARLCLLHVRPGTLHKHKHASTHTPLADSILPLSPPTSAAFRCPACSKLSAPSSVHPSHPEVELVRVLLSYVVPENGQAERKPSQSRSPIHLPVTRPRLCLTKDSPMDLARTLHPSYPLSRHLCSYFRRVTCAPPDCFLLSIF